MMLPAFDYITPRSLPDALAAVGDAGTDAKLLAGGQSLIPMLAMRLVRPSVVVDIGRLAELRYVEQDAGRLHIGALVRHRDLERSPEVRAAVPVLAAAAALIGHEHVRGRGTIGGSLAHADPAAEYPVAAVALDATIGVRDRGGERRVPAEAFFLGPLTTALRPSEILTEVSVPVPPAGHGWAFREFALRSGDFALAAACAVVTLDAAGRVETCRVVVGGVGPVPQRCQAAPAAVTGGAPAEPAIRAAAEAAAREVQVEDRDDAPVPYRRRLVAVLVRDALCEACAKAAAPGAAR